MCQYHLEFVILFNLAFLMMNTCKLMTSIAHDTIAQNTQTLCKNLDVSVCLLDIQKNQLSV